MKRAIFRQLTIGALVLVTVGPASAQQQRWVMGSEILVGLKGLSVVVEHLNPEAERDGLYKQDIVTAIELRLRETGVRVLTLEETRETPRRAYLYCNFTLLKQNDGRYAYTTTLELMEAVRLADGRWMAAARTWQAMGHAGSIDVTQLRSLVDHARELTDQFLNDYLKANPRK